MYCNMEQISSNTSPVCNFLIGLMRADTGMQTRPVYNSSAQIFGRRKLWKAHARFKNSLHVFIWQIYISSKEVLCILFSRNNDRKLDN